MTDLSHLIDNLCAGLDSSETSDFPVFPESLSGGAKDHPVEYNGDFRSSRSFRSENKVFAKTDDHNSKNHDDLPSGVARDEFYILEPERPERPETEAKTLAGSTSPLFPVEHREPERPETEDQPCGRLSLDLNHAAPQRSDWWTGPLMAEVDAADVALPIPPAKVRAGVERELRALATLGRDGPNALRDAVAITRAKVRNSEALAERQAHDGRCHVCGDPLDDAAPVISVLTGHPGRHLHLDSGCHAEHVRRVAALVDRIMTAAGYGADRQGEAE